VVWAPGVTVALMTVLAAKVLHPVKVKVTAVVEVLVHDGVSPVETAYVPVKAGPVLVAATDVIPAESRLVTQTTESPTARIEAKMMALIMFVFKYYIFNIDYIGF
jgi:hypothetical protein